VSHQSPQPVQDESEAAPESRQGILQANQRRISAGAGHRGLAICTACKHIDDLSPANRSNKDTELIREGLRTRNGKMVWAGAEACARDLSKRRQWDNWTRECSDVEYVSIAGNGNRKTLLRLVLTIASFLLATAAPAWRTQSGGSWARSVAFQLTRFAESYDRIAAACE
jgi:hypothetical protein